VESTGPGAAVQAVLLLPSEAPAAATARVRAVAMLGDGASLVHAARQARQWSGGGCYTGEVGCGSASWSAGACCARARARNGRDRPVRTPDNT
jgi:hypothetical protein